MNTSLFPAPASDVQWDGESRTLLNALLSDVANTRLKVEILSLFLCESGLCLSSACLAKRLGKPVADVQSAVKKLADDGALHYCPHFAYSDVCSLSLSFLAPPMRLQLGLLRFALRHEPNWVWQHFARDTISSARTTNADEADRQPFTQLTCPPIFLANRFDSLPRHHPAC